MRKKISIVLFIIIFGTICVSYIKNKTRDLEKEILKLKQEQTDLVEKLKNEKLENNYLSAPEYSILEQILYLNFFSLYF